MTGVCSHPLFQGIFPTQGSTLGILHCRQILCYLSHKENSVIEKWGRIQFKCWKKIILVICIKIALKQWQISQNFHTEFHTNLQRKVEQMKIIIFPIYCENCLMYSLWETFELIWRIPRFRKPMNLHYKIKRLTFLLALLWF